jgi:transposase
MQKIIIGIDMSKASLDLCVRNGEIVLQELKLSNAISELKKFFKKFLKDYNQDELLICCEFTSHYTYPLCFVCEDFGIDLWLESPYQIKHSSGLVRGKNDKVDARRIADYAIRFQDKSRLYSLPDKNLASLKALVSERDLCISHKIAIQGQLTDQRRLKRHIKELEASILAVDEQTAKLISDNETLSNQHKLLCSVDGIGTIIRPS